ncbi:MAG TPA: hypothetical protein VMM57_09225 [Bacteroidota bacterium]|nr:hypothetical protein [Bacteroidota bacterium]
MEYPAYEFSEEQNATLSVLARRMKFVGLMQIFLGVLIGCFCALTIVRQPLLGVSYLLQALLAATFGVWTNSASFSFKLIVETTGRDMDHLMEAVASLRKLYNLQFILLALVLIFFLATLLLSFTMGVSASVRHESQALSIPTTHSML